METAQSQFTPEQWSQLEIAFAEAIEVGDGDLDSLISSYHFEPVLAEKLRRMVLNQRSAANLFSKLGAQVSALAADEPYITEGDLLDGRFRIVRFVASGGMGEVYEAEDAELGGTVAVKVMRSGVAALPGSLERFRDEVRLAREISSPYVCRVYDVERHTDAHRDFLFLTMEFLAGEALSERIARLGRLPLWWAGEITCQLARGMSAAHQRGILHRDFKSGNVMISGEGASARSVITDFGLSRSIVRAGAPSLDGLTTDYAAPELLAGAEASVASDIYALGVVIHEMLTGALPNEAVDPRKLRPDLPVRWQRAMLKCLEPDPAKRFQDAAEVAAQFARDGHFKTTRRTLLVSTASAAGLAAVVWRLLRSHVPDQGLVAVFPFAAPAELQFLADGICDRIADGLGRVPGARVIGRAAAARLVAKGGGPDQAKARLNARFVLTGNLQANHTSFRLHLDLTNANTRSSIWSATYDGDDNNSALLPPQAVRAMAPLLSLGFTPPQVYAGLSAASRNPESFRCYLLGRFYADKREVPWLRESARYLERSVALDSKFAGAFAALALTYFQLAFKDEPTIQENIARSRKAVDAALELDPKSAEAYMALAAINHWWNWDWAAAEAGFKKAIEINPSLPQVHHWYARMLYPLERFEEAIREIELARDFDPLNPSLRIARGIILTNAGRLEEAMDELRSVIAEDPGSANAYVPLSVCLEMRGRLTDALQAAEQAVTNSGRQSFAVSQVARIDALLERYTEARTLLTEIEGRFAHGDAYPTEIAAVYAAWNDAGHTLEWLEKGVAVHDLNLQLIKTGPEFKFLAADARFQAVAGKVFGKKSS